MTGRAPGREVAMVCVDSACSQDRPQIGCWPWVWGMQTSLTSLYPGCPFWKESALIGQAILEGGEAPSPSQWSHSRAPRRQFPRRPLGTGQGGSLVGAEEDAVVGEIFVVVEIGSPAVGDGGAVPFLPRCHNYKNPLQHIFIYDKIKM